MRKGWGWFIVLIFCLLNFPVSSLFAESRKAKTDEEERLEQVKRVEAKKAELNGSEWQIDTKSASGGKGFLPGTDTLIFQNGQFSSKFFSEKGFSPTNYTLTVPESEEAATIWETMQTSPKGEIVFWRGEWREKGMAGTVVRQLEKGNEDYYFSSTGMKKIPPTSSEEKEEVTSEEEPLDVLSSTPVTPPTRTEEDKPKKKSWFS